MPHRKPRLAGLTGLEVIAAFKFVKAAALIVAGLGAFGLMNGDVTDAAQDWLERLALGNGHHLAVLAASRILPYFTAATPRHFATIGLGAFLYASVFLVEGVGLWRGKRWAEWFTIGVTVSLLPLEIIAIIHRVTIVRVGALAINIVVIAYLFWQLRARQRQEAEEKRLAEREPLSAA